MNPCEKKQIANITIRLEELFHAAAFDKSGNNIRVADVWESEEDLNEFVNERLIPVMQQSKVPTLQMQIFQIHNVDAFSGIEKYRIK